MKLIRKAFKAWLESKVPQEGVGSPDHPRRCPLCRFVRETQAAKNVFFQYECYEIDDRVSATPKWAERFQKKANALRTGRKTITVADALKILDEC